MKIVKMTKKGFSLLEILLVLAIAATLVIGAFIIYPKARDNANANTLFNEIGMIRAAVQELYGSRPGYLGLNNQVLRDSNLLPKSMYSPNGQFMSHAGNNISLSVPWNTSYSIQISNVSNATCIKLVKNLYNGMKGVNTVQINNTGYSDYSTDMNMQTISNACSRNDYGTTTPDNNFVSIQFSN